MPDSNYIISTNPEEILAAGWSDYVLQHPNGNYFQLPEAYALFSKTKGYEPLVIAAIDSTNNKIAGILLSVIQKENKVYGWLTRRCITWGGPLYENVKAAEIVMENYDRIAGKKAIYSQFRNLYDLSALKTVFEKKGYVFKEHLNNIVATQLETKEAVLNRMSKSRARQIRKSSQEVDICNCVSVEELKSFYELLKELYKSKIRKPLPDFSFFKSFHEESLTSGTGRIFLVKHRNQIIGGILCPVFKGKAIYEWYIAGLDKEYKEYTPSVMATWAAIQYGQEHQLQHFDFLGAGSPESDYGVREFKEKFGGEAVAYGRFEKAHRPLLMKIGIFGIKLLKRLK